MIEIQNPFYLSFFKKQIENFVKNDIRRLEKYANNLQNNMICRKYENHITIVLIIICILPAELIVVYLSVVHLLLKISHNISHYTQAFLTTILNLISSQQVREVSLFIPPSTFPSFIPTLNLITIQQVLEWWRDRPKISRRRKVADYQNLTGKDFCCFDQMEIMGVPQDLEGEICQRPRGLAVERELEGRGKRGVGNGGKKKCTWPLHKRCASFLLLRNGLEGIVVDSWIASGNFLQVT